MAKNCALEITSIRTREDYEQHLIITKSGGNTKKQKEKKQKEALKQMKVFDNFKIQGWKKIKTGVSTLMKWRYQTMSCPQSATSSGREK